MNGIEFVRPGHGFKPSFQLTEKVDVNGDKEHGLWTFLKKSCPTTRDGHADKHQLFYSPLKNSDIRWNFEKFLIDHNGKPVMRYDASAEPLDNITDDLESVIRNIHLE